MNRGMTVLLAAALLLVLTAGTALAAEIACGGTGTCLGTQEDDEITGTSESDVIRALGGDDTVDGGNFSDEIYGGEGNDRLIGDVANLPRAGNDELYGGPGSDFLSGADGHDIHRGGDGDDTIDSRSGECDPEIGYCYVVRDDVYGGPGNDSIYSRDSQPEYIDCGEGGRDRVTADSRKPIEFGDQVAPNCEIVDRP